jgi:hypothetical protein
MDVDYKDKVTALLGVNYELYIKTENGAYGFGGM